MALSGNQAETEKTNLNLNYRKSRPTHLDNNIDKEQGAKLLELFKEHKEKAGEESTALLLQYIRVTGKIDDKGNAGRFYDYVRKIEPKLEENIMTIEQADRQFIFDEGVEQNRRQTVLNMLEMNMAPLDIAKISQWPVEQVLKLRGNRALVEGEV